VQQLKDLMKVARRTGRLSVRDEDFEWKERKKRGGGGSSRMEGCSRR